MTVAQTIKNIRRNAVDNVWVAPASFVGRDEIGVRAFAEFSTSGGEKKHTKNGISLNRESHLNLISALPLAERDGAVCETIGEELTEAEAQSVFEGYADQHPHVCAREAMLLPAMRRLARPLHDGGWAE